MQSWFFAVLCFAVPGSCRIGTEFPWRLPRGFDCFNKDAHQLEVRAYCCADSRNPDCWAPGSNYKFEYCCQRQGGPPGIEVVSAADPLIPKNASVGDDGCLKRWLRREARPPLSVQSCPKGSFTLLRQGDTVIVTSTTPVSVASVPRRSAWLPWRSFQMHHLRFSALRFQAGQATHKLTADITLFQDAAGSMQAVFRPSPPKVAIPSPLQRPNFYFLVLDSTSRISSVRYLPKVRALLAQFGSGQQNHLGVIFNAFHTLSSAGTVSTLHGLQFGGVFATADCVLTEQQARLSARTNSSALIEKCATGRLLEELKAQGYRTGVSASHPVTSFFHPADIDFVAPLMPCPPPVSELDAQILSNRASEHEDTFTEDYERSCHDFRCVGERQLYCEALLAYNDEALQSKQPTFLWSHLHGAHYDVSYLAGLDQLVADHLQSFLARDADTFVFVLGDHGHRDAESCDVARPFLAALAPRKWLSEEHRDALLQNENALVTPFDLRATVRHLAGLVVQDADLLDRKRQHGKLSEVYTHIGSEAFVERVPVQGPFAMEPQSVLKAVPRARSCAKAGIAAGHCTAYADIQAEQRRLCADFRELHSLSRAEFANETEYIALQGPEGSSKSCEEVAPAQVGQPFFCLQGDWTDLSYVCTYAEFYVQEKLTQWQHFQELCTPFKLSVIEWVSFGQHARVRFSTLSGRSYEVSRVYEMGIHVPYSSGGVGRYDWVQELTRYARFEPCTPQGVDPIWCTC
eukprot:TRINITY_DN26577_c0_g2_i1.p1 TRINITY_DN26577_c0_g2~~TRINITY_DN26577_c0_g2_i1.p1  ORF type:complete len:745 (+),score=67.97 TRINITY_DN26577_c0_g2_i1:192-2426(+)